MDNDLIDQYYQAIEEIAADFGLDTYPNQLEIISAEQMLDAYASVGMPLAITTGHLVSILLRTNNPIEEAIWAWPMK